MAAAAVSGSRRLLVSAAIPQAARAASMYEYSRENTAKRRPSLSVFVTVLMVDCLPGSRAPLIVHESCAVSLINVYIKSTLVRRRCHHPKNST